MKVICIDADGTYNSMFNVPPLIEGNYYEVIAEDTMEADNGIGSVDAYALKEFGTVWGFATKRFFVISDIDEMENKNKSKCQH